MAKGGFDHWQKLFVGEGKQAAVKAYWDPAHVCPQEEGGQLLGEMEVRLSKSIAREVEIVE